MFGGEFSVTLDEANRIALPKRIRDAVKNDKIVITRGVDECLWLYTTDEWEKLEKEIVDDDTNIFDDDQLALRRIIFGPNQDIDIDKQGRILIPPRLRTFAGLSRECIVLGQHNYIEVWAEDRYQAYLKASEEAFKAARRKLAERMKRKRDLGDDSPRSGAVGTGSALPGAEERE